MHSNKALSSRLFQFSTMAKSIMHAIIYKPDDQAEWRKILHLMYNMRQKLTCSVCGKLVTDPYFPTQEPCHCVCGNCRNENAQMSYNSEVNPIVVNFVIICKLLVDNGMVQKWSNLQVSTQDGPITFCQLTQGHNSDNIVNCQNLNDKFRKRVKQKEHHCRCGSGAKKNDGRGPGNLTCLGQRCACYKEGKACVNCKCVGCKNPNGISSNETQGRGS